MSRWLFLLLALVLANCSQSEEKSTFVYRRNPDGEVIRTEMRNGSANGRIICYHPSGRIDAILHVQDSVLTGNTYQFYPSGRVAQITPHVQGRMQGRVYHFYENGALRATETYANDEKTGPAVGYYSGGNKEYTVTYWKGQATGDYVDFYDTPPNRVRRRVQYVLVRGKQWGTGHIDYSPTGKVTQRVNQLTKVLNRPHYAVGDSVVLTLTLQGPQFPLIKATIAAFDSLFNGNDSTAGQVFYGHKQTVHVVARPQQRGWNVVRGYVTAYDSSASPVPGALYQTKEKAIYFQQPYWVK
jgi:hypothetical protein